MKLLLAEDETISRRALRAALEKGGHEVVEAEDGAQAWSILQSPGAPRLALLDWMMPGMDGVELCRRIRAREGAPYVYLLLITAKGRAHDVVTGLDAGADDYLTKPCNPEELRCRVRAGERILHLESALEENIAELEEALAHVEKLQGLLPMCMHCKSIRDDSNTWHRIENYIENHSDAMFTHALCNSCLKEHYPDYADSEETADVPGTRPRSRHKIVNGLVISEPELDAAEE